MALYFPNSNSLLLLTPKTGSVWVREALGYAGIYSLNLGPEQLRGHGYLALYGRNFETIGAFVRHPVTWHRSYWAYRTSGRSEWDMRWDIDRQCWDSSFHLYVEKVCRNMPQFTSKLFARFVGPESDPISFIGRQENLVSDLCDFLHLCGETFSREKIEVVAPQNTSENLPDIGADLIQKICTSESHSIRRFGYDLIP